MQRTRIQDLELNAEQSTAVFLEARKILVLAGAGTGKTRTLTARVAHLIEIGISPRQIWAVTFTNKAAAELRRRLQHLIRNKSNRRILVSTFHSFCYRVIDQWANKVGYRPGISILDERDREDIITHICEDLGFKAGTILKALRNKNPSEDLTLVMDEYRHRIKTYNCLDFNMLQELTVQLLEQNPDALYHVQLQAKHILIDEFQDIDPIQSRLIDLLNPESLFVIGDDWQSIYAFRGADPRILLDFKKKYPTAHQVILPQNYRSTQQICEVANRLIKFNSLRTDKEIRSAYGTQGDPVTAHFLSDSHLEAAAIADICRKSYTFGYSWGDICILARTNAHLAQIVEQGLIPGKIPVQALTHDQAAWHTKTARGFLYLLKTIVNPRDYQAQHQALNFPFNRIDRKSLSFARRKMATEDLTLFEAVSQYLEKDNPELKDFLTRWTTIQNWARKDRPDITDLVATIDSQLDISATYRQRGMRSRTRELEDYVSRIREWKAERVPEEEVDARAFCAYMVSLSIQDSLRDDDEAVKAMTVHSAKGLEFPIVIIAGCVEKLFPHALALKDGGLEERRLFYVAMTRAEKLLAITTYRMAPNEWKPWEPAAPVAHSRFIDEALGRPQVH